MNRRTFFTSLVTLGASPALGVAPVAPVFHGPSLVDAVQSSWDRADVVQIDATPTITVRGFAPPRKAVWVTDSAVLARQLREFEANMQKMLGVS